MRSSSRAPWQREAEPAGEHLAASAKKVLIWLYDVVLAGKALLPVVGKPRVAHAFQRAQPEE